MTSGNEPRRKRRADSFRRDEADEADNWLAGLRGSSRGSEPDPFAAPPPQAPAAFDQLAALDRPAFDGPDYGPPGRPAGPRRSPADDSPSGSFGRAAIGRRGRDDDSGSFPGAFAGAPGRTDPPARPPLDPRMSPDATQIGGGRRRARDDDSPSGSFARGGPPPARPALDQQLPTEAIEPRGGRRRARDADEPSSGGRRPVDPRPVDPRPLDPRPSESYEHGPELVPIIKPLADFTPPRAATEPPPLVPIFPSMRPDSSPTSGPKSGPTAGGASVPTGRRARRAAEDPDDPPTGARRRFDGPRLDRPTGAVDTSVGRRHRPDAGESDLGRPRAGRRSRFDADPAFDESTGYRSGERSGERRGDPRGPVVDETTGFRRGRGGFYPGGPADPPVGFEMSGTGTGVRPRGEPRRPPGLDEAPHQRRALDDALPGRGGYDEPVGRRRRGTGEYTGEFTTGGTRRALREPPGGRPGRAPGRGDTGPGRGTGTHPRPAVIDPVRTEHRPHRWVAALSIIGVVVLLGACGLGSWFVLKDERNGPDSARANATAGPKKRDISSRQVDPNPLTEAEVFPSNNIVAVPNEPPYVILKTQLSQDCKSAATEELATLLAGAGCSEVVRATMKSPNEEYLITAGIFNLDTEQTAETAFKGVKPIVDGQRGRFAGMSVGPGTGTDALVRAPTQLGWNYKGHFIAYCVIARVDGNAFAADDPYPNQITYDIVETYLENGIIGGRAIVPPEATPAASLPSPS